MIRKNLKWIISGIFIILLFVLVLLPTDKPEENIPLPPNVVVLEDGSILSLSHYFDNGYWRGMNDALEYMVENNYLRSDTSVTIHLEFFIERNNIRRDSMFNKTKNK